MDKATWIDHAKDSKERKLSRSVTLRESQVEWLAAQKGISDSEIIRYALDLLIDAVEMGDQLVGDK